MVEGRGGLGQIDEEKPETIDSISFSLMRMAQFIKHHSLSVNVLGAGHL